MPRLFIAIELPTEVKKSLGRLRIEIPGARWVPPEQIHLTLAFVGDQDADMTARLIENLSSIHQPEFSLAFTVPGCFPDIRRPRVLWVGLEPEPLLARLAGRVREAALACGISLEERPFSPHITLARLKLSSGREATAFLRHPPVRTVPVMVREFTLFESRLSAAGAIHTQLKTFPLAGDDNLPMTIPTAGI